MRRALFQCLRVTLSVSVASLASGCGEASVDPLAAPPLDEPPWIEVGTGRHAFVAVDDGAPLELVRGTQGGYHVLLGVRGRGFDAADIDLRVRLEQDGRIVGGARLGETMALGADSHYASPGIVAVFDISEPSEVEGRPTRAHVELTDRDGLILDDDLDFVPLRQPALAGDP